MNCKKYFLKIETHSLPLSIFVHKYTKRFFVRVNDKNESKFILVSFQNGESRGFIILIHIMESKFNIATTIFNIWKRQCSILNTKYYESPFEKLKVQKKDIMITNKLSKNNFKLISWVWNFCHCLHYRRITSRDGSTWTTLWNNLYEKSRMNVSNFAGRRQISGKFIFIIWIPQIYAFQVTIFIVRLITIIFRQI